MKKYVVCLGEDERRRLTKLATTGKGPARVFTRARILLEANESDAGPAWPDEMISVALDVTVQTVESVRKQLVEEGLEAVLERRPYMQKRLRKKIDGTVEAHLIALSCSDPPPGRARWTLRLLADKIVELGYVGSISHEAIRKTLKKRTQAMDEGSVVYPAACKRRFCLRDGRHSHTLHQYVQPEASAGLYG